MRKLKKTSLESEKSNLNHLLTLLTVAVTFPIVIQIIPLLLFSRLRSVIKRYHVTYNVTFVVRGCNRVSVSYNA